MLGGHEEGSEPAWSQGGVLKEVILYTSLQAQVSFRQEEGRKEWREGREGGGAGRGKEERKEDGR